MEFAIFALDCCKYDTFKDELEFIISMISIMDSVVTSLLFRETNSSPIDNPALSATLPFQIPVTIVFPFSLEHRNPKDKYLLSGLIFQMIGERLISLRMDLNIPF